jgi:hypothetical protein
MSRAHTPSLFPDAEAKPKPPAAARLAFDIEIANVFEAAPGEDLERYGPFDISCAAIATDRGDVRHWFKKDAQGVPQRCIDAECASDMLAVLREAQLGGVQVCAWNGLSFDTRWLGWAARDLRLAAEIALDLYDPMFQFVVQRGFPVGLAAVAEGLGIEQRKLMHGADAPKEWAAGHHQKVLDYVAGDCQITERVVARIVELGEVRWRTKKGGVSSEPMPKLERVRDLLHRPAPDTSWMSEPIRREKFYEWLVPHSSLEPRP